MITLLKKLFKRPQKKPFLKKGDSIRVTHVTPAKKVYTALDCQLDKNMLLLYKGETEHHYFFVVRTKFYSMLGRMNFANDRDEVFIKKEVLKASNFRKLR
jgi:hypothetical protein